MLNRFRIGVRIGAGFAVGLAMLTVIGVLAYRATNALVTSSALERHTYEVLGKLGKLDTTISAAESAQRGYIVTGQTAYLDDYRAAISQVADQLASLQEITADNPGQQQRLAELEPLVDARIERMNTGIRLRQEQGFTATQQFAAAGEGKRIMQQIRALAAIIETQERQLLAQRSRQAQAAAEQMRDIIRFGIPACFAILFLVGLWLSRNISRPLQRLSDTAEQITAGNLSIDLPTSTAQDEIGMLTRAFRQMVVSLRQTIQKNEQQRWLKTSLANLSQTLQGQRDLDAIAQSVLSHLVPLLGAQQGVLYYLDSPENPLEQTLDSARETAPPKLRRLASYAAQAERQNASTFLLGEGLVGQCALEKQQISLEQVPPDYVPIRSGLGEAPPVAVIVTPLLFESQVQGVIELAALEPFGELELALLEEASSFVGVMINAVSAYQRTQALLQASQTLTDELRQQQQELVQSNQLLEERTQALQMSELLLQEQQEELQQSNEELQQLNEELEEKADLLEVQKQQVEWKNAEIEQARQSLEVQAEQLVLSSRYKSEFLANMSHELRTPLNSLLILAKLLSENSSGNLTDKQIEYSRTIHSAGNDLLTLINDILDLAKIESGTMAVAAEPVSLAALRTDLDRTFRPVALSKGLRFAVELADGLPATIVSDARRLQQILKNLLSNALKFTEQGEVSLLIESGPADTIVFAVRDSGIGISADKQQVIFEAFQQADGTTSRRYGGTGLGLSISLELARLLNASIDLVSQPQQGSTFTLRLPRQTTAAITTSPASLPAASLPTRLPSEPSDLLDDRDRLNPGDQVLLIIEDDLNFARILIDMARQHSFKVLVATQGQTGLILAQRYLPNAITLDLHLPDMPGWAVLEQLKRDPTTRHVPIHVMTVEDQQPREFQLGAIAHIQKPVSPEVLTRALSQIKRFIEQQVRHLLVIEDDPVQAQSIIELIGGSDVESTAVSTGAAALAMLKTRPFDCAVLDLGLPDMNGFDLIEQIKQEPSLAMLPIVVYTGKDLSAAEETRLRRLAETIIVKDARSPERLLDETALFLHRVQANLPQAKQQMLDQLYHTDPALAEKQVLIIDDDVRNIFALTSLLEQFGMVVLFAENGRSGLELLESNPGIDVVLMDVMMPELDGYETTRLIRQQERFRTLPIITLTAKAMQGDREKCIDAGASDYISKPVDPDQLLSLLRLWLHR